MPVTRLNDLVSLAREYTREGSGSAEAVDRALRDVDLLKLVTVDERGVREAVRLGILSLLNAARGRDRRPDDGRAESDYDRDPVRRSRPVATHRRNFWDRADYELLRGVVRFRDFTADDCAELAARFDAQAAGLDARASWLRRLREAIVIAGATRAGELPAETLAELEESF